MLYSDWIDLIKGSELQTITWLFCPGHSGVQGNERADKLAGTAVIGDQMTLRRWFHEQAYLSFFSFEL